MYNCYTELEENITNLFIRKKVNKRSKSLVQRPGVRKNLSVIESYITDTV